MDIRPEIGVSNPSWLSEKNAHLYRGDKEYSNDHYLIYGYTPEDYANALAGWRDDVAKPDAPDWQEDYLKKLFAANDNLEPDDPQSPIQRNNQPMAAHLTDGNTSWKDDNGNYMPAVAFRKALLDDKTGGSYKDYIREQGDNSDQRQQWLNNHHGGRGLGYMGQNKFPSATYDMAQRKAAVQANARRIRGMS